MRLSPVVVLALVMTLGSGLRLEAQAGEQALYEPALAKFQAGDVEGALAEIAKVEKRLPKDGIARYYRGVFLEKKGDSVAAEKAYRAAIDLAPDLPEARSNLCALRIVAGEHGEAISLCEKAVALRPDFTDAWHNLGIACQGAGRDKDAVRAFEKVVAMAPSKADAWMNLGALRLRGGDKDKALASLAEAARLAPRDYLARFNYGAALAATGRLDKAAVELEEATRLNPRHAPAFSRLGSVLRRLGHGDAAVAAHEAGKKLLPNDAAAALELGLSHAARAGEGDALAAAAELTRAEKLAKAAWEPPYYLGLLHARAGRCSEARAAMERYRQRDKKERMANEVRAALAGCQGK
ncbi:MAG: tetratricopeptide repeat protein [Deltaproteobacteria bacterium]|nr:tetratricopeptide repeat protein [Deltaproteobacteria bacterium]